MKRLFISKPGVVGIGLLISVILALFVGCAGLKHFGKYKLSDEVKSTFGSSPVPVGYHFYYSGSSTRPTAIMGILKSYTLTATDLWTRVVLDPKTLQSWVESMQKRFFHPPYGYYILDPDGNRIGIYYTPWDPGPVKMEGNNRVSIYLPHRDVQPQNE